MFRLDSSGVPTVLMFTAQITPLNQLKKLQNTYSIGLNFNKTDDVPVCVCVCVGMACCGEQYVNTSATLCCAGPDREPRAHVLENRTASLKCCWTELIEPDKECCNGVGFDPNVAVCADQVPRDLIVVVKRKHIWTVRRTSGLVAACRI